MKKNRCIRKLPLENLALLKHPIPEKIIHPFGEEILKDFDKTGCLSSDDSDILTSIRDIGTGKSSSSSLSWGEEYKSEASKAIQDELQRMDRVLQGLEPIPDCYDKEEYEEWMQSFPNLCVLGVKCTIPAQIESNRNKAVLRIRRESSCDSKIKPVITIKSKITVQDSFDVDTFIKVSPIASSRLPKRQSSSRSLISSHLSSSKWLKDEEYNSLPFLIGGRNSRMGVPKGILKNSVVLPPIEPNQFRSISARPRRPSAISGKDSGFKRRV